MPGLSGTGLVADDLYLMAHHEITGKPYLQPRALGLGLAGGLLAELMLEGSISLRHDGIVVADRTPPGDGLARHVLSLVLALFATGYVAMTRHITNAGAFYAFILGDCRGLQDGGARPYGRPACRARRR